MATSLALPEHELKKADVELKVDPAQASRFFLFLFLFL